MPPQRKSGGKILRDGFCVFTRITGLAFHSDAWTLILSFSKGRGSWFFGLWTFWFYKGYDLVFRILDSLLWFYIVIRFGFSGRWTGFSIRILDYLIMCFRLLA